MSRILVWTAARQKGFPRFRELYSYCAERLRGALLCSGSHSKVGDVRGREGNFPLAWSYPVSWRDWCAPASCLVVPAERSRTTPCPPFRSQAPCSGGESCWDCCLPLWPPGQDRASRRGDKNRRNDGARSSPI